jgi:subtilisin family serine protease
MNRTTNLILLAVAALDGAVYAQSPIVERNPAWMNRAKLAPAQYTNRMIVKFRGPAAAVKHQAASAEKMHVLSARAGIDLTRIRTMGNGAQVLQLPEMTRIDDVRQAAARIAADAEVEYAEPDYRRFPLRPPPADPRYLQQWYLSESAGGINAPQAWDITVGSPSVVVAVLDTGILPHADLSGRLLQGYDFVSLDFRSSGAPGEALTANDGDGRDPDSSDPGTWISSTEAGLFPFEQCPNREDSSWHGTHVAGIIAANANNNIGIAGVDWNAKILPVRALGKCGGYTSDIADGARWAVGLGVPGVPDNGSPAQVLNFSLGGSGACSRVEQEAIDEIIAGNRARAFVVAAGNEAGDSNSSSPANCNGVISVAATNRRGELASYSNFGPKVTLSAPGGESNDGILSLNNTGATTPVLPGGDTYAEIFGTSSAAPQVSGVISLMLSVNPNLGNPQIVDILKSTARGFFDGGLCPVRGCGAGIVDAFAAVAAAQSGVYLSVNPAPAVVARGGTVRINISNPSTSPIAIGALGKSGAGAGDFDIVSNCGDITVPGGGSCFADVTFAAGALPPRSALFAINSNASVGTTFVAISGTSGGGGGSGSSGGGGCTIGPRNAIDPVMWLLIAIATAFVLRRRETPARR